MHLPKLLTSLAAQRPLFHSEADFQHALAWEIHSRHPNVSIRLEYPTGDLKDKEYVDIWVELPSGGIMAIELKYKTRSLNAEVFGQHYRLREHSARDEGRFDLLHDVERLERLIAARQSIVGAAVLHTIDSRYWKRSKWDRRAKDAKFRLYEGRHLTGVLAWRAGAANVTMGRRKARIKLVGCYAASWTDYCNPTLDANCTFRYLLLDVRAINGTRP